MSLLLLAVTAAPVTAAPLPLRSDEVLSVALVFRVAVFTGLLLLGAYVVLRLYSRLAGQARTPDPTRSLACDSALRLSARTKVYLVRAGHASVLITESTGGSQVTVLPAASPSAAARDAGGEAS